MPLPSGEMPGEATEFPKSPEVRGRTLFLLGGLCWELRICMGRWELYGTFLEASAIAASYPWAS